MSSFSAQQEENIQPLVVNHSSKIKEIHPQWEITQQNAGAGFTLEGSQKQVLEIMTTLDSILHTLCAFGSLTSPQRHTLSSLAFFGNSHGRGAGQPWGFPWFLTRLSHPPSQWVTSSGKISHHVAPRTLCQNGSQNSRANTFVFPTNVSAQVLKSKPMVSQPLLPAFKWHLGKEKTVFQKMFFH